MHCTEPKYHRKRRGTIHPCDWCGEPIEVGERYARWSCYDDGSRISVLAHEECCERGREEASYWGETIISYRRNERPPGKT